jgi:hypothetical protein
METSIFSQQISLSSTKFRPIEWFFQGKSFLHSLLEHPQAADLVNQIPPDLLALNLNQVGLEESSLVWNWLTPETTQKMFELLFFSYSHEAVTWTLNVQKVLWFLTVLDSDEDDTLLLTTLEKLEDETLTVLFQSLISLKPVGTLSKPEEDWAEEQLDQTPNLQFYYEVKESVPEGEQALVDRVLKKLFRDSWAFTETVLNLAGFLDSNESLELVNQFRKARLEEEGFLEQQDACQKLKTIALKVAIPLKRAQVFSTTTLPNPSVHLAVSQRFKDYPHLLSWLQRYPEQLETLEGDLLQLTKLISSARFSLTLPNEKKFEDCYRVVLLCLNLGLEVHDSFQVRILFEKGWAKLMAFRKAVLKAYCQKHVSFEEKAQTLAADGTLISTSAEKLLESIRLSDLKNWFLHQEHDPSVALANLFEWNPVQQISEQGDLKHLTTSLDLILCAKNLLGGDFCV